MNTKSACARCPAQAKKRGYCQRHYELLWRVGLLPVIARSIDSTAVRERIAEHLDRGRSVNGIAKAAGVAPLSLRKVYVEGTPIRATTAQRVMAVPLPPSRVGIERRLQALARIGYSRAAFCRASGISEVSLGDGLHRGPLTASLRSRIVVAYERLSATPYDAPRTVKGAIQQGYHAPADWEYLDIDDPYVFPVDGAMQTLGSVEWSHDEYVKLLVAGEYRGATEQPPPRPARIEAVERLTAKGWTAKEVGSWLRMDARTVERMKAELRGVERILARSPYCRSKQQRHLLTPENTRVDKSGRRHCMECEILYKQTHKRSGSGNRRTTVKIAA